MRPAVAVIGGGVSVSELCAELARAAPRALDDLDIRLVAQDFARLSVIAGHSSRLVARLGRRQWSVTACATLEQGIGGAAAVVLLVRVGGLAARMIDEQFPVVFGATGDEGLGPGGYANALRTLPVLDDLASGIRGHAPAPRVFNLMAPLGLTTRLLLDRGIDAVGVCELPIVTEQALERLDSSSPRAPLSYAGLNHLGWFWPDPESRGMLAAAVRCGLAGAEAVERFGAVPLKYYYRMFDPGAAARLGMASPPGRAVQLADLVQRVTQDFAQRPGRHSRALGERPMPWFRDALVPMLIAHLCGTRWRGFANVRNDALTADLPAGAIIETRLEVNGRRLTPRAWPAPLPRPVREFVATIARAESLVYQAWRDDDPALVREALRVCSWGCDPAQVEPLTRAIVEGAARPPRAVSDTRAVEGSPRRAGSSTPGRPR
jgi:6-phospho-beta-glucosidase